MSRKVIENLAVKYENVAKGVCRQMGGKVLNYEAKDILNRGRAEGEAEGIARMQRAAKLLRMGKSISDVAELTELSEETVTELDCRRLIIRQIKMIEDKRTRRVAHSYKSKTRLGGFCYKSYTINKDICQSFLKLTFLLNPDFFRIANRAHGRHAV